jgi:hypothetical protein
MLKPTVIKPKNRSPVSRRRMVSFRLAAGSLRSGCAGLERAGARSALETADGGRNGMPKPTMLKLKKKSRYTDSSNARVHFNSNSRGRKRAPSVGIKAIAVRVAAGALMPIMD